MLTCFPENAAHDCDSASVPDTFGSDVNSTTLPSPTPSSATSLNPSVKVYVLMYNATVWAHDETTDKITLMDGTPITVEGNEYISPATVQPVGVLGVYYSEAKARKAGKAWLYDQLTGLGVQLHLPLPIQDGSETTEPDWRRSGWQRTADGSWGYTVSDFSPRHVALTVLVTGRPVADEDGDDDDDDEYHDSDDDAGKQEYLLVGPVGRRRRVVKTGNDNKEEKEEKKEEKKEEEKEEKKEEKEKKEKEKEKEEADGEGVGDSTAGGGVGAGAAREEEKGDAEREGDDMDIYWDQNSDEGDLEVSDASGNEMEEAVENKMEEVPNE